MLQQQTTVTQCKEIKKIKNNQKETEKLQQQVQTPDRVLQKPVTPRDESPTHQPEFAAVACFFPLFVTVFGSKSVLAVSDWTCQLRWLPPPPARCQHRRHGPYVVGVMEMCKPYAASIPL